MTVAEATPVVYVWPDNALALKTFTAMSTQWRAGNAGPIGLDYGVIPSVLRLYAVPRAEWEDTFDCLRVMEDEALATMKRRNE